VHEYFTRQCVAPAWGTGPPGGTNISRFFGNISSCHIQGFGGS